MKKLVMKQMNLEQPSNAGNAPSTFIAASGTDTRPSRQMTFGEKLVGLNFNPSNDSDVDKAKRLCAELADLVDKHWNKKEYETTQLSAQLYNHTIGEILNAQMNVVKLLTLKY